MRANSLVTKVLVIALLVFFLGSGFVQPAQAQSSCGPTYVVQPGDWMAKIARACGVSYSALLAANPQIATPWLIYPGQVLAIPGGIPNTGSPSLSISPTSGAAGTTVSASGAGFTANSVVRIGAAYSGSSNLVTEQQVNANASGAFTTSLVIPPGAAVGSQWVVRAFIPGAGIEATSNVFTVSGSSGTPGTYTIQRGDTMYKIATRFGIPLTVLLAANPQITTPWLIYPGQVINLPGSTGGIPNTGEPVYYTVQRGDTLRKIADAHNTTWQMLAALNPQIWNPNIIYPGQVIRVA